MKSDAQYKVTIERRNRSWIDGKFKWQVTVYINGNEEWHLNESGYVRSLHQAKKKALKHILKIQSEVDLGVTFGINFETKLGTAEEMKEALGD